MPTPTSLWRKLRIRPSPGAIERRTLNGHGDGQETGSATGIADVGDDGGFADERRASILRASEPQTYPYDSATLVGIQRQTPSESAIGFNAGADVGVYFTRWIGVGGTIRFTRATVELNGTEVAAGGLLASGGLRVRF